MRKRYWLVGLGSMIVTALLFTMILYVPSKEWMGMEETFFGAKEEPLSPLATDDWRNPNTTADPDVEWTDDGNAIDGNTGTYAYTAQNQENYWLYCNLTVAVTSDKLRVYVCKYFKSEEAADNVDIDVYNDSSWSTLATDVLITENTYTEYSYTQSSVSSMRIRAAQGNNEFRVKVVQFNAITPFDVSSPWMNITFAGNPGDKGGPKHPTNHSGIWNSPLIAAPGYYTNSSWQQEDFINITVNASDDIGVSSVKLHFLNETTWDNSTYSFTQVTGTDLWYCNVTTLGDFNYSFDVNVTDSSDNITIAPWDKQADNYSDYTTLTRRWVRLCGIVESLNNTIVYLHKAFSDAPSILKPDKYKHDQGDCGGPHDTGLFNATLPPDIGNRTIFCSSTVAGWYDMTSTIAIQDIDSIYAHIWWNQTDVGEDVEIGVGFGERGTWGANRINNTWNSTEDTARCNMTEYINNWGYPTYFTNGTYEFHLECNHYNLIVPASVTDNSIYELLFGSKDGAGSKFFSNRSMMSFYIINPPINATLQTWDNDSDGLNNWEEMYITWTDPYVLDTDADGVDDYWENQSVTDSDPNNYTETYNVSGQWQVINSSINGSLYNSTQYQLFNNTINGSLWNSSAFSVFSNTINGSVYNSTQYTIFSNNINGSLYNGSQFNLISSSINGSLWNSTAYTLISNTINGSLYNSSQYTVFSSDINGSIYNSSVYTLIDSTVNGSLYNTSQFSVFSNNINGSIWNVSQFTLFSDTVNGSIYNQSLYTIISDTINGSIYNLSGYTLIDSSINGIIYNQSQFTLISSDIDGTIYNGTGVIFPVIQDDINGSIYNGTGIVVEWVIVEPGVYFDVDSDNDRFGVNSTMAFTQIWINDTWIKFNETGFNITFGSFVNISLTHIDDNPNDNVADELVCGFWTNSSGGTVWFNISGFNASGAFYVDVNKSNLNNYNTNATGVLSFSHSSIGNRLYEVYNGTSGAWQVISNSINGSIYNVSAFSVFSNSINGSLWNSSDFVTFNSDINGSIYNSSVYVLIDSTINGSLYNSSDEGTSFYVSNDGVDSNPGTQALPWENISKVVSELSNNNIIQGDDIYFERGDTFNDAQLNLDENTGGSSDNWMFIGAYGSGAKPIFSYNSAGVASIAVDANFGNITIEDIHFTSNQFHCILAGDNAGDYFNNLTVRRCDFNNLNGAFGVSLRHGEYYKIENCTFDIDNNNDHNIWIGGTPTLQIRDGIIRNCTMASGSKDGIVIHYLGDTTESVGPNLWIENCTITGWKLGESGIDVSGGDNCENILIENCEIYSGPNNGAIAISWGSHDVIIQDNYIHDITGSGNAILSAQSDDVIIRNNRIDHRTSSRHHFSTQRDFAWQDTTDTYIYHNTLVTDDTYSIRVMDDEDIGWGFKNNIFYSVKQTDPREYVNLESDATFQNIDGIWENNIWYRGDNGSSGDEWWDYSGAGNYTWNEWQGISETSGELRQDPELADIPNNWSLNSSSVCIDGGTWLTQANGGSTGTTITVDDAGYFFSGISHLGVDGDNIFVGSNTNLMITNVDYDNNNITVNRSITWSDGNTVSLSSYNGSAPDIGAIESSITATAWQIINNTINGSLYNTTQFQLLFNNINGSLWNSSAFSVFSNSINGSIYNSSQFTIISNNINGSVYNGSQFSLISSDINGSLWNGTAYTLISNIINGSIYNQTLFTLFSSNINGSLWNSSVYTTFSSDVNGSIYNTSQYTLISSNINGSLWNSSAFTVISNTINGSLWNSSDFVTFNSEINGSIYNLSAYTLIDSTINGSIYNTSQFSIFSNIINGSLWNVSQFTLFSDSINGSLYNQSVYTIISNTINGSIYNTSQYQLLFNNINGSLWNVSAYITFSDTINGIVYNSSPYTIIQNNINGSIFNITIEIDITGEYPANESNILVTQPTLYFNLTNPTGQPMNYSIYIGDTASSCDTLIHTETGVGNGTQFDANHLYYSATNFSTSYWWRVSATDGTISINETFFFQSLRQGGGGISSRLGTAIAMAILAGISGSIIGSLLFMKKRKNRRL